ncbi:MAG: hypothetical protein ACXWI6_06260 [Burkholderiales bacterium]
MSASDSVKEKCRPQALQPCPLQKGTLAVVLVRSDTGAPIKDATAAVNGPTPGTGATDPLGAVIFKDRTPGAYTARVTLPAPLRSYRMTQETPKGSVSANGTEVLLFKAAPIGNLYIDVYDDRGAIVTDQAELSASGPSKLSQGVKTGSHTFANVACGTYEAFASVPAALFEAPSVSQKGIAVLEGGTARVRLVVKRRVNVVTPKIEMEYKVVVLDRKLSAHQDASEKKILTDDVTYVRLSANQSTGAPSYTGHGTFEVSPANVEIYVDKECTNKLAGRKITNRDLISGNFNVYLKAKTKGKFTAKLTLDPSKQPNIEVKGPAQEEMGVVELEFMVHRYEQTDLDGLEVAPGTDPAPTYHTKLKAKAIPDQKGMTDEQKIKVGRMIHVQDGANHARAKMIVKKLVADQWPAGTDDYDIVLNQDKTGGAVTLFDQVWNGTEKPLPHKIKVKELKANNREFWIEGKADSSKVRDIVLDEGLDRSAGGLPHNPKRKGDWARFTSVKIKEVKFTFSSAAKQPVVWDGAKARYFVNTDVDAKGRELKSDAGRGRSVKVVATLSHALKDVIVHFMLANDKANYTKAHWGAGVPGTFEWGKLDSALKAKDRTSPNKVLHFSAKTDSKGLAECKELVLSRLGGDKFKIGAYIDQDPHLAKYVHGHADLEKKTPVLSPELQVWRKGFVQISRNKATVLAARASTRTAFEEAYAAIDEIDETQFDPAKIAGLVEHPKWQFYTGDASGTKIICVGDHNKTKFHGLFKVPTTATTPKVHIIMCDAQWDPEPGTSQDFSLTAKAQSVNYKNAAGNSWSGVFDPPLSGGNLLSAGSFQWNDGTHVHRGAVTVEVRQARGHTSEVRIKIPDKCPAPCVCGGGTNMAPTAALPATASIRLSGSSGPWGGESGSAGSPHCLIVVESNSAQFNHAIAHEIGHMFQQVRKTNSWLGLPDHPDQYIKRGGQGSHCKKDATEHATRVDEDGNKAYEKGTCIMFGTAVGNVHFCDNCKADLRVRDMSDFFK